MDLSLFAVDYTFLYIGGVFFVIGMLIAVFTEIADKTLVIQILSIAGGIVIAIICILIFAVENQKTESQLQHIAQSQYGVILSSSSYH